MSKVRRVYDPPEVRPEFWVKRLEGGESYGAYILSSSLFAIESHWCGHDSIPCTDPVEECLGHQRKYPLRCRAYLHCWSSHTEKHEILEITEGAAKQIFVVFGKKPQLRGVQISIKRHGGKTGLLKVSFGVPWQRMSDEPLPAERPIEPSLWNVWRKAMRREGVECD